eukprot:761392-Hanusia_phi.AAC.4
MTSRSVSLLLTSYWLSPWRSCRRGADVREKVHDPLPTSPAVSNTSRAAPAIPRPLPAIHPPVRAAWPGTGP